MSKRFVLKGIPSCFTEQEILSTLLDKGIEAKEVRRLKSRREDNKGQPIAVAQVLCERQVNLERLRKEAGRLCHVTVTWDHFKSSGLPVVCRRCQGINHHEGGCQMGRICGVCAGKHSTEQCITALDEGEAVEVKCHNCGDKHRAGYRGCKAVHAEAQRVRTLAQRFRNALPQQGQQGQQGQRAPKQFAPAPLENPWEKRGNAFPPLPRTGPRAVPQPPSKSRPAGSGQQADFGGLILELTDAIKNQIPDRDADPAAFMQGYTTMMRALQDRSLHSMLDAAASFIAEISK